MSGSSMVAIVTPIVMLPLMAFWLIMVFHADSHPGYRHRPPMPVPDAEAAVLAGAHPEVTPPLAAGGPPAIAEHEAGTREKVPAGR